MHYWGTVLLWLLWWWLYMNNFSRNNLNYTLKGLLTARVILWLSHSSSWIEYLSPTCAWCFSPIIMSYFVKLTVIVLDKQLLAPLTLQGILTWAILYVFHLHINGFSKLAMRGLMICMNPLVSVTNIFLDKRFPMKMTLKRSLSCMNLFLSLTCSFPDK